MNTKTRPEHIHVTLVDLQSKAYYSGMVPGCISELYTLDQGNSMGFVPMLRMYLTDHFVSLIYSSN